MVFSQMPIFMKLELGASEHLIGSIDGVVEFISHLMRIVAGPLSDLLQNRKVVIGFGYGLSTLVKPLFALSSSVGIVILIRSLDRITNGLQASPRDALIGDLAPPQKRGASYGLSKSLKTGGSVVGAALVVWIMTASHNNFRLLFLCAFVPGLIALILFIFGVKQPKPKGNFFVGNQEKAGIEKRKDSRTVVSLLKSIRWKAFLELKTGYWRVLSLVALYELAHVGETYLTFRATEVGIKIAHVSLVMLAFNLGQFFVSYPIGVLSDKFKRYTILMMGFLFLVVANTLLIVASSSWMVFLGVFFWGAQIGTSQSIFVAMISDETPAHLRGTAFGIFYLIMGVDIMIASKIAGIFWDQGSHYIFLYSLIICTLSIGWLYRLRKKIDPHQPKQKA